MSLICYTWLPSYRKCLTFNYSHLLLLLQHTLGLWPTCHFFNRSSCPVMHTSDPPKSVLVTFSFHEKCPRLLFLYCSADNILKYFSQKTGFEILCRLSSSNGDNLHEALNPVFWKYQENYHQFVACRICQCGKRLRNTQHITLLLLGTQLAISTCSANSTDDRTNIFLFFAGNKF